MKVQNLKWTNLLRFRLSKLQLDVDNISAMVTRNSGRPLVRYFLMLYRAIGSSVTNNWVRITVLMCVKFHVIAKREGLVGLVLTLKTCSVCLQQSIAGHYTQDISSLGRRISRTNSGLPRIIPHFCRKEIRRGNALMIRYFMTLFALYRVLIIPAKIKISTITSPYSGDSDAIDKVSERMDTFVRLFDTIGISQRLNAPNPFPIYTSSPNAKMSDLEHSTHFRSIARSYIALTSHSVYQHFETIRSFLPYSERLETIFRILRRKERDGEFSSIRLDPSSREKYIGKLGLKVEPAGKMRVFAMGDCFSQWLLSPIHDALFKLLKRLPMDGTFDQLRFVSRIDWTKPMFSFDLSAATDRLPIELQQRLLGCILKNKQLGESWAALLVARKYLLPYKAWYKDGKKIIRSVKYAVGQPMGLKSSWPMLAVTHHFLVQVAAWNSGFSQNVLFDDYVIVGDDIVIFNASVAGEYRRIMKALGLEVNISKSVLSPSGRALEFCKKTFFAGHNVSGISLKELAAALSTGPAFIEFTRIHKLKDIVALRILQVGNFSSFENRIVRLFFLLKNVPRTGFDLTRIYGVIFRHIRDFVQGIDQTSDSRASISSFVRFLRKEMNRTERRLTDMYYLLIQSLSGSHELRSPLYERQGRYLVQDLYGCREQLRGSLMDVVKLDEHLVEREAYPVGWSAYTRPSILFGNWEERAIRNLEVWANQMIKAQELIADSGFRQLVDESMTYKESLSQQERDFQRNQRLWNQWLHILAQDEQFIRGITALQSSFNIFPYLIIILRQVLNFIRSRSIGRNYNLRRYFSIPRGYLLSFRTAIGFWDLFSFLAFVSMETIFSAGLVSFIFLIGWLFTNYPEAKAILLPLIANLGLAEPYHTGLTFLGVISWISIKISYFCVKTLVWIASVSCAWTLSAVAHHIDVVYRTWVGLDPNVYHFLTFIPSLHFVWCWDFFIQWYNDVYYNGFFQALDTPFGVHLRWVFLGLYDSWNTVTWVSTSVESEGFVPTWVVDQDGDYITLADKEYIGPERQSVFDLLESYLTEEYHVYKASEDSAFADYLIYRYSFSIIAFTTCIYIAAKVAPLV